MPSQMSKDFKMKSRLRALADGGSPNPEMPHELTGGTATSIFTPQEMKNFNRMGAEALAHGEEMAQSALHQGQSVAGNAVKAAEEAAMQFRGFRDGGRVEGPGGRTDDKVGPVMLSDEEYVLPGDTADAIGRDKLDAIRLATHDFKSDAKESALRRKVDHLADGGSPWIADDKGNVRKPNAFGDRAAGPGYTQPKLPPPTASNVGPASGGPVGSPNPTVNVRQGATIDITPEGSRSATPVKPGPDITDVKAKTPLTRAAGVAKSALRGGAPLAGVMGAVDAGALGGGDLESGYRDHFQKQMGVETPLGSVAADTARTLASVGDAATFGLAGRVGRGIAGAINGDGFVKGFTSDSDREKFEQQKLEQVMRSGNAEPSPATTVTSALRSDRGPAVQQNEYQSRRLSEMGVPVDVQNSAPVVESSLGGTSGYLKTGGTDQFQNLGSYGGNANIYGRAGDLSRPGRINEFVGVGNDASPNAAPEDPLRREMLSALRGLNGGQDNVPRGPADNSYAINKRFDDLSKRLSGMYGKEGQGNLARRLLELETARANALDADARNITSRGNAELNASTLRRNADLTARNGLIDAMTRMEQTRATTSANAQAAQLRALQDAQKTAREGEEKGFDRYTEAIGGMFVVEGEDGKQTVDKAAQERFRAFIEGSDPKAGEKFAAMSPQQQQVLLQNFKTMFDMNEQRNATAASGSWPSGTGGVTNRMDMPVDVREATWNDYWNNNLPLKDYMWSNLPLTNRNVVVTESGQPVLYSDYTTTGGERDLDKEKIVHDSVAARRSPLRSN